MLRCGRRFGKTALLIERSGDALTRGRRVGVFVDIYSRAEEIYHELAERLGPLIKSRNATKLRLRLINGGILDVWSFEQKEVARSRKYHEVFLDEAGLVQGLVKRFNREILPTIADYPDSRAWILGTNKPQYPGLQRFFLRGGKMKGWASFTASMLDNPHIPRTTIEQMRGEMTDEEWDQEVLGKALDGAFTFFPERILEKQRVHSLAPGWRGDILPAAKFVEETNRLIQARSLSAMRVETNPERGCWRIWGQNGPTRPEQHRAFVIGVDIGAGVGASLTVFSVIDVDTGALFARFRSSKILPEHAARLAALAGIWFGGRNGPPLIVPERNGGHGETFVRTLRELGYPAIYRDLDDVSVDIRDDSKFGFYTTASSKERILSQYRAALDHLQFINHDAASIDQCALYVFDENGRLVVATDDSEDDEGARVPHGDDVIADALAWLGQARVPRRSPIQVRDNSKSGKVLPTATKDQAGSGDAAFDW